MSSKLELKLNKNSIAIIATLGLMVVLVAGAQAKLGQSGNASQANGDGHDTVPSGTLVADLPELSLAETNSDNLGLVNATDSQNKNEQSSSPSDQSIDNQSTTEFTTEPSANTSEKVKVEVELEGEGDADVSETSGDVNADFSNNDTLDGDRNKNNLDYKRDADTDIDNDIKVKNDDQDVELITGNNTIKDNKNPITVKPGNVSWNLNSN